MQCSDDDDDKDDDGDKQEEEEEEEAGCSLGTVLLHTPLLQPVVSVNRNFSH